MNILILSEKNQSKFAWIGNKYLNTQVQLVHIFSCPHLLQSSKDIKIGILYKIKDFEICEKSEV